MTDQFHTTQNGQRNDSRELDEEVGRLLAVNPSPQFLAQVRARLSTERVAGRRWMGWAPLTAVGAVVAGLLIVSVVSPRQGGLADRRAASRSADVGPSTPAVRSARSIETGGSALETDGDPPHEEVTVPPVPDPRLVIVSSSEARALKHLFAQAVAQQAILPSPRGGVERVAPLEDPAPLLLAPITIEPLRVARLDKGALQ